MISERESELQGKIRDIETACRKAHEQLEELLKPVREPLGEYARELKALQTERFTAETGLKMGDELYPTAEFIKLQSSNGRWWEIDDPRPLRIGDSTSLYVLYNEVYVEKGASGTAIPAIIAFRMRHAWLNRLKSTAI